VVDVDGSARHGLGEVTTVDGGQRQTNQLSVVLA
jgi:hypothetical protein